MQELPHRAAPAQPGRIRPLPGCWPGTWLTLLRWVQGSAHAAQPAARRSSCEVMPVDMTFLGTEGLITDRCELPCCAHGFGPGRSLQALVLSVAPLRRNRALLVISCSRPAQGFSAGTLEGCMKVQGPATHSFANLGFADARKTSFQTFLSWEVCRRACRPPLLVCGQPWLAMTCMQPDLVQDMSES